MALFQGDVVRAHKEAKADPVTIKEAVTELKARIKALELKVCVRPFFRGLSERECSDTPQCSTEITENFLNFHPVI